MKTPWMLLRDLEDLFTLEQKGSITKEKYLSMKKSILRQVMNNNYSLRLDIIEQAEKLHVLKAITKAEYEDIKELTLEANDPDAIEAKKQREQFNKMAFWAIVWVLAIGLIIAFSKYFWTFVCIALFISMIPDLIKMWIQGDIISSGIKKSKK